MKDYNITFSGSKTGLTFEQARESNKALFLWQQKVSQYFDAIDGITDISEKNKKLIEILDNKLIFDKMNSNQLMRLFKSFRDVGNFADMMKVVDRTNNTDFKYSSMVTEQIILSHNKINRPLPAMKWGMAMLDMGIESSNTYNGLGESMDLLSQTADTKSKKYFLKSSATFYEKGFTKYGEYSNGINAATKYLELDDIEKAKNIAKLVYLTTLKENHNETSEFWCASARLQASCIASPNSSLVERSLNHLLNMKVEKWHLDSTIESLKKIQDKINSPKIDDVIEKLSLKAKGEKVIAPKREYNDKFTQSIYANSYSYCGLASIFEGSNSIGGNTKFGGQLPDHSVSRKDFEFFDKVLTTPIQKLFPSTIARQLFGDKVDTLTSLNKVTDINEFMDITDKFIRYHFGTDNFLNTGFKLETNVENPDNAYNTSVHSLLSLASKKGEKSADTRTNVSAMFALGLGDCRHHAQVKQIMFDRWRDNQINLILKEMRENGITHDLTNKYHDILRTELRTIDVCVQMPIALNGTYNAVKTNDGKFVYSQENSNKTYEEHTLNILVTRDKKGQLEDLTLADAFYQNVYDFSRHHIDTKKDITIDENGKFHILAGTMSGSKVDNGKDIPIMITPTGYAGKRDKADNDEHGNNVKLVGLPLGINSATQFISCLQHRNNSVDLVNELRYDYTEFLKQQEQAKEQDKAKVKVKTLKSNSHNKEHSEGLTF